MSMIAAPIMTKAASLFHPGEQTIQSLAGVRDCIELYLFATTCRAASAFFAALPFMVAGLTDHDGHPRATTLSGPSVHEFGGRELLAVKARLDPGDPLHSCIRVGALVGGLGIEFSTRRPKPSQRSLRKLHHRKRFFDNASAKLWKRSGDDGIRWDRKVHLSRHPVHPEPRARISHLFDFVSYSPHLGAAEG
jgi:hypothetical protein